MLRMFVCVVVVFCSHAMASSCAVELDRLAGMHVSADVDASAAASLLAAATSLAEPALPAVRRWSAGHAPPNVEEPAIRFLIDRDLLPGGETSLDALPGGVLEILDRLLASFGGDPVDAADRELEAIVDLRDAIDIALGQIRDLVRPAAVLVWDDQRELALRGLVWNWSSYPRLVLFPPHLDESRRVTRAAAIASMENCVREIDHWFSVDEATARRLLAEQSLSRLVVVGTEPDRPDLSPWWVPSGEELDVLAYEHPAVRDLDAFSVVFTGSPVSFTTWLRLLPSVRTNASPIDLRRYLLTPPAAREP